MTIKHDSADLGEVTLHYAHAGSGDPILFLHGFPDFWYSWRHQLTALADSRHAVALDQRGYNLSSKPPQQDDYHITKLVGDIRDFAGHMGWQKFDLVGHDWGGVVAWAVAIAAPELLKKLVILNAPHPGTFQRALGQSEEQKAASQYIRMLRSPNAEELLSAGGFEPFFERIFGEALRAGHVTEADKAAYIEAWSQPGALTGSLNWYRASTIKVSEIGATDELATEPIIEPGPSAFAVRVPTLVIWGEQDTALRPVLLEGLDEFVADLRIVRIPDASHWVNHEKTTEVTDLIREFVNA